MKILLIGTILFFIGFITNVIIWREFPRKRSIKNLFKIFFIIFSFGIVSLLVLSSCSNMFSAIGPQYFFEYFYLFLFFVSLSIAYFITYSAIEVDSPSLMILMHLGHAGAGGLSKEDLLRIMTNEYLIEARVKDLLGAKMISTEGDKYKINFTGIMMARFFILFRRLLRLPKGG